MSPTQAESSSVLPAPRPLRILIGTLYYPPHVRGGYELATALAVEQLRARGHRVEVVCGKADGFEDDRIHPVLEPRLQEERGLFDASFEASNLERWRLHVNRPANGRATRAVLRETDAQVYLAFNQGLVSIAPLLAARRLGLPTLIYACDLWPTNHWLREWRARGGKRVRRRLLEQLWKRKLGPAGVGPVIATSEYLADELAVGGVPRGTIDVAHLSCPPDAFALGQGVEPNPRGASERLRVLCASMWWEGKGVHVALDAVERALKAGVDLELELAGSGSGEYAKGLRERAQGGILKGRVTLSEGLDRSELLERFLGAHAVVVPSQWGEPFALVPLEAAATGCAVVATRDGGNPEFVHEGQTGRLVDRGDGEDLARVLGELFAQEDQRLRLASAAKARVGELHSPGSFVDRIESKLLALTGESSTKSISR